MRRLVLAVVLLLGYAGGASAAQVGYFNSTNTTADTLTAAAITAAGHTPVALAGLTAGDLAGLDVLWILNSDNGGYGADITNNLSAIDTFVRAGGVLSFHDRRVTGAEGILPGASGVTFVRDFSNDADIDILNNTTLVTNGPGGVLNNTSLDGGNSSDHGYAVLATLPTGAVAILNRGGATTEIVDFYYGFGAGFVYYSTIPLDFYLTPTGNNPPGDDMRNVYAPNEVAFQASLSGAQVVPEPATVTMLALGSLGLCGHAWRRRRAKA